MLGPQFDFPSVPEPFGTKPVPEGHVRVSHYTDPESVEGIKKQGLHMEKAHESFARGGTEYPSIFATAGAPSEALLRTKPVVEAHIPVSQLDVGRGRTPEDLESRNSTVTTNEDVPAENIIAIHEPWHQTFNYIKNDPSMEKDIMGGMYDAGNDPDTEKAIGLAKIGLINKVMLGGKLQGR